MKAELLTESNVLRCIPEGEEQEWVQANFPDSRRKHKSKFFALKDMVDEFGRPDGRKYIEINGLPIDKKKEGKEETEEAEVHRMSA